MTNGTFSILKSSFKSIVSELLRSPSLGGALVFALPKSLLKDSSIHNRKPGYEELPALHFLIHEHMENFIVRNLVPEFRVRILWLCEDESISVSLRSKREKSHPPNSSENGTLRRHHPAACHYEDKLSSLRHQNLPISLEIIEENARGRGDSALRVVRRPRKYPDSEQPG